MLQLCLILKCGRKLYSTVYCLNFASHGLLFALAIRNNLRPHKRLLKNIRMVALAPLGMLHSIASTFGFKMKYYLTNRIQPPVFGPRKALVHCQLGSNNLNLRIYMVMAQCVLQRRRHKRLLLRTPIANKCTNI